MGARKDISWNDSAPGSITADLWAANNGIFRSILDHPFLRGLTSGGLPEEAFRHYVVQDAFYLRDYLRLLALLAARSERDEHLVLFCEHAKTGVAVEDFLHDTFFTAWGIARTDLGTRFEPAPTTLLYTGHLTRIGYTRPWEEALAAVLPCYWIYWEVGKELVRAGSPSELYRKWIDTYAGEEFGNVVREILAIAEEALGSAPKTVRRAMAAHFRRACQFEWMFWDMGWRRETWPVG